MGCGLTDGKAKPGGPRDLGLLTSWDADWSALRVVVAGIGQTGFSAADTLIELGARVVVVDGKASTQNQARADTLRIVGAAGVLLGPEHTDAVPLVDGAAPELVIASPGWSPTHPVLSAAAAAGIPIWGDVELAWRVRLRHGRKPPPWLCITGTNGKTTTVGMTESILRAAGLRAIAAGNVGTPILDVIRDPDGYDMIAVELSSFQLHWTESVSPLASVCLNVAQDHVDWHGGYQHYLADKARVYERTQVACIYNADQRDTEKMVEDADVVEGCRAVGFTTGTPAVSMLGVVDGLLVDRAFIEQRKDSARELAATADLGAVVPRHLVANALAAAALARAAGVAASAIREGLRAYLPGEHRIQVVTSRDGVLWVNDSKATNPHAAAASLASFQSVVWIAGGLSKGVDYDDLVRSNAGRLRAVVVIGTDATPLSGALNRHAPDVPVFTPGSGHTGGGQLAVEPEGETSGEEVMKRAVAQAALLATDGDTVLMAPAAASMDQFSSYAHRGEAFVQAVRSVVEGQANTAKES